MKRLWKNRLIVDSAIPEVLGAAPVAVLAVGGYTTFIYAKNNKLKQEKERLYQEALRKHDAIQKQLKDEVDASKDRILE